MIFAGFIRRWLEKVRPGKAVKKADLLNEGLMALAGIMPQDKRPRDLLPLNLPQLQDGHVPAFLGLGFPDTAEMVDYLDNCGRSEQNIHWKYQGSQHYENIGDLVKMSAALCEHPDEFLKVFVWNMTVAYFPDKLFAAVGTYFRLPHPEVGLKPTEATFAYAVVQFVVGDNRAAEAIAKLMYISPELARNRTRYQDMNAVYLEQKNAVDRLMNDIDAHIKAPNKRALPNWRDYIRRM